MFRLLSFLIVAPLLALPLLLSGCKAAYYSAMESLGYAKRDILIERVDEGRRLQEGVATQIETTYDALVALTGFEGGELEAVYRGLERDYRRSEAQAEDLRASVRAIEDVALAMFAEWRTELEQIQDPELREASRSMLEDTRGRYTELLTVMQSAVSSLEPVLVAFHDQVLFLEHNLNAMAIRDLDRKAGELEDDVTELIERMRRSIEQSEAFLAGLRT